MLVASMIKMSAKDFLDSPISPTWRESLYCLHFDLEYDYDNILDPNNYFADYFINTNQYQKFRALLDEYYSGRGHSDWIDLLKRTSDQATDVNFLCMPYMYTLQCDAWCLGNHTYLSRSNQRLRSYGCR